MNGVKEAAKDRFDDFPAKLVRGSDVRRHGFEYLMIDELGKLLDTDKPAILNHDVSTGLGTHWAMIYLQREPRPTLYYYDPLGPKFSPVPQALKDFAARYALQLVVSPYSHQYVNSNLCGYYAIVAAKVIEKLIRMGPMTPGLFIKVMYAVHGASPDRKDVERLVKLY